jgi:hypothetical protein
MRVIQNPFNQSTLDLLQSTRKSCKHHGHTHHSKQQNQFVGSCVLNSCSSVVIVISITILKFIKYVNNCNNVIYKHLQH